MSSSLTTPTIPLRLVGNVVVEPNYPKVGNFNIASKDGLVTTVSYVATFWNSLNLLGWFVIRLLAVFHIFGTVTYTAAVTSMSNPMSLLTIATSPLVWFAQLANMALMGLCVYSRFEGVPLYETHFNSNPMVGVVYGLMFAANVSFVFELPWVCFGLEMGALLIQLGIYWMFPLKYFWYFMTGKAQENGRPIMTWFTPLHKSSVVEYVFGALATNSVLVFLAFDVWGQLLGACTLYGYSLSLSQDKIAITIMTILMVIVVIGYCLYNLDFTFGTIFGFTTIFFAIWQYQIGMPLFLYATVGAYGGAIIIISGVAGIIAMRRLKAVMSRNDIIFTVFPGGK